MTCWGGKKQKNETNVDIYRTRGFDIEKYLKTGGFGEDEYL